MKSYFQHEPVNFLFDIIHTGIILLFAESLDCSDGISSAGRESDVIITRVYPHFLPVWICHDSHFTACSRLHHLDFCPLCTPL